MPKGNQKFAELLTAEFNKACQDYFYMINRHYPERGCLKLIGDRYRLGGDQRTILYRGISSRERSLARKARLVSDIRNTALVIDGYNVLFTLLNYRQGRYTFISTDGILRDAGSLHGRLHDEATFTACLGLLVNHLAEQGPLRTDIFLDAPVSHSAKHTTMIRQMLVDSGLQGDCFVVRSADYSLKQSLNGILATSDTAIIDHTTLPVTDLSRAVLEHAYNADFILIPDIPGIREYIKPV